MIGMIKWEMFTDISYLKVVLIAYLLGSLPFSVWIGKLFYGIDVREHGSGNAGTTNTLRVLGFKAAIPVLILDILKGFLAVRAINFFDIPFDHDSSTFIVMKMVVGLIAVIGHIYPIFAGFKGGKGVATIFGVVIAMHWGGALAGFAVFAVTLYITRYVSLGSILGSIAFGIMDFTGELLKYGKDESRVAMLVFSVAVPALILFTHRSNIKRLRSGTENKIRFSK